MTILRDATQSFSFIVTDDPTKAYTARGCYIDNPQLFPQPINKRRHRSLRILEKLNVPRRDGSIPHEEDLYGADPDCDHYITYRRWDGVFCVRCNGWFCA